jgi:hypothetical protein
LSRWRKRRLPRRRRRRARVERPCLEMESTRQSGRHDLSLWLTEIPSAAGPSSLRQKSPRKSSGNRTVLTNLPGCMYRIFWRQIYDDPSQPHPQPEHTNSHTSATRHQRSWLRRTDQHATRLPPTHLPKSHHLHQRSAFGAEIDGISAA